MDDEVYYSDANGRKILLAISPNDEMYNNDRQVYLDVSASAMQCIDLAMRHAGKKEIRSVLDLPCGHGRVLRSLVSYFPEARIVACDLNRDGVDFCSGTFGAEGVYSDRDVSKIPIHDKYDLIWCGSLLTHLSEEQTRLFLDFFIEHLEDDGILVASFHGRAAMSLHFTRNTHAVISNDLFKPMLDGYNKAGFGYSDYAMQEGYGVSLTKPSWFMEYVENRTDSMLLYYSEQLWAGHQDAFAIQKKCYIVQENLDHHWETFLQNSALPLLTHTAKMEADDFLPVLSGCFSIDGWALLEMVDSFDSRIFLIMQNEKRSYLFNTRSKRRDDVTEHFGNQADYGGCGFEALVSCNGVARGVYRIGALVVNGEAAGIAWARDLAFTVV